MTYPTIVGRGRPFARRALLALSTILASGLAVPALAQTGQQESIYQSRDANGVDLTDGSFDVTIREGSIGAGEGAIELLRFAGSRGMRDNLSVSFLRTAANGVATINLTFGGRRETFSGPATGTTFASGQGNGAVLTKVNASEYRYMEADGTVTTFGPPPGLTEVAKNRFCGPGSEASCGLTAVSTVRRNGVTTFYDWDVGENCVPDGLDRNGDPVVRCAQFWRLRGLHNNLGYRVRFGFQQEQNPATGVPDLRWSTRTSAVLSNDRVAGPPRVVSYSRPATGVVEIIDDGGRTWRLTSTSGGLTGIKRPGASSDTTVIAYGSGGVTSVTRDGVTTAYNRVVSGNVATTTVTNALSQAMAVTSDLVVGRPTSVRTADNQTTGFTYDGSGRLKRQTAPEGNSRDYTYDARGNVTQATAIGKPVLGSPTLTSYFGYAAACSNPVTCNLPESSTDARGNTTSYEYDQTHGGVTSVKRPAGPNGIRPEVRYGYAPIAGSGVTLLTSISECQTLASCAGGADERRTTITYGHPNLLTTTVSAGSGDGALTATTTLGYDAAGNVISVDGPLDTAVDTTVIRYNAAREQVGVISPDPDGAGPLSRRAQRLSYNADGQVTTAEAGTVTGVDDTAWAGFVSLQQATATYDANGRRVLDTVIAGGSTYQVAQYSYDALGRIDCQVTRMNPAAFGSTPGACSLGVQGADGPDRITRTTYDELGRVQQVLSAYGTPEASANTTTYTPNGQVLHMLDGNSNATRYDYDGFDRLSATVYPSKTVAGETNPADYEQLGYDAGGNVTSRRLRDGQVIGYSYDALGRRTYDDNPNTTVAEVDASYTYDNLGRLRYAIDQNNWAAGYDFDALGRLTRQFSNVSSNALQYDAAGRMTRQTWADGFFVTYEYDQTGAMTLIRENGGLALATFTHDELGRRKTLARGNGTVTTYGYDPASRLTQLTQDLAGTAQDLTLSFGYNAGGQIASRTASNDAYGWTGHGNTDRAYAVNGLNQAITAGPVAITHDARGNIIGAGGQSYQYNTRNQLFTNGAGQLFYRNPAGLLNHIIANGVTNLDYVGADLATEFDGNNGQVIRRYVHGPGVDEPLVWYEGAGTGDRRYLHADERGSIVAVTNGAGAATAINTYDEYGRPGAGNQGRFQYTGQKWIAELGLYDYKARMYAPQLGRFMQTDPIGYADGMNLYGYVGGDPVNGTDPSGLGKELGLPPTMPVYPVGDIVVTARIVTHKTPGALTNAPGGPAQGTGGDGASGGTSAEAQPGDVVVTGRRIPPVRIGGRLPRIGLSRLSGSSPGRRIAARYDPSTNYCGGGSGPRFPNAGINDACYRHDVCYDGSGTSQLACDIRFAGDILVQCTGNTYIPAACAVFSLSYFQAVRSIGFYFYRKK